VDGRDKPGPDELPSRRLAHHHVVEAGLHVLHQFAEARPFLAEFRRLMRRRELVAIAPLKIIDDVAAVLAAVQGDRDESRRRIG